MNALRLLIALAILAVSCTNTLGPENDPNIEIQYHSRTVAVKPCGFLGITNKSCTFLATVVEDRLNDENRIKVRPVSDVWNEELWISGPNYGPVPRPNVSDGDTILIAAHTNANGGKWTWNYSFQ
jgi:hypothetical protein